MQIELKYKILFLVVKHFGQIDKKLIELAADFWGVSGRLFTANKKNRYGVKRVASPLCVHINRIFREKLRNRM